MREFMLMYIKVEFIMFGLTALLTVISMLVLFVVKKIQEK